MKIYLLDIDSESGDHYIDGYWTEKPTEEQISKYLADHHPDDYEADALTWYIKELDKI